MRRRTIFESHTFDDTVAAQINGFGYAICELTTFQQLERFHHTIPDACNPFWLI